MWDVLVETGHGIVIKIVGIHNFCGQAIKIPALKIEPSGKTEVETTASCKERGNAIGLFLSSLHDVNLISTVVVISVTFTFYST